MARIIETAKGNSQVVAGENGTLAVNTIVKMIRITSTSVLTNWLMTRFDIESTLVEEDFDADFLHDDFSWVHDFQQW